MVRLRENPCSHPRQPHMIGWSVYLCGPWIHTSQTARLNYELKLRLRGSDCSLRYQSTLATLRCLISLVGNDGLLLLLSCWHLAPTWYVIPAVPVRVVADLALELCPVFLAQIQRLFFLTVHAPQLNDKLKLRTWIWTVWKITTMDNGKVTKVL